ncbi:MAG TPA: RCC1 domain-containing protein [Myxococcota bacterium]|nr:RCC1 domain-containing protein [Myxococcota bacterium]HNH48029.1 RCC1 domain-containing protein [Myxococcota bacterium]
MGCALDTAGEIQCWGESDYGLDSPPAGGFRDIAVDDTHACAVAEDWTLVCWGQALWWENFDTTLVPPAGEFRQVAVGDTHACALTRDGSAIECWGDNYFGQTDVPE